MMKVNQINSPDFLPVNQRNRSKQSSIRLSKEQAQELILKNISTLVIEKKDSADQKSNELFNETTHDSSAVMLSQRKNPSYPRASKAQVSLLFTTEDESNGDSNEQNDVECKLRLEIKKLLGSPSF